MTDVKTVASASANYSQEMIDDMIQVYTDNPSRETAESLAKTHDKTIQSMIAKLVALKVYAKSLPVEKVKEPVILKAVYIEKAVLMLGISVPSIKNMTKEDLIKLVEALEIAEAAELLRV